MPQGVRRGRPVNAGARHRALEGALQRLLMQVMAALHARAWIDRQTGLREDPEPGPLRTGLRVFAVERVGHEDAAAAGLRIGRPQHARAGQLLMQLGQQRGRQHHRAVFASLAATHDERAELEVDILDAQLRGLGNAQAGAAEQLRQQALLALQQRQNARHLLSRQHHRQARRPVRPADRIHPRKVLAEHLLVQKQQRRQGLPMRGHRHLPVGREPGKKSLDLALAHVARVAQAVEAHKRAHPMDVGLLSA
jgi:hypothetical protein